MQAIFHNTHLQETCHTAVYTVKSISQTTVHKKGQLEKATF